MKIVIVSLMILLIMAPIVFAESPGILVGTTDYGNQTNGSIGHRVALDSRGGVHFTWTNYLAYPTVRNIYYNYVDSHDAWLGPVQASSYNLDGYPQLTVSPDDRGILVYHRAPTGDLYFAIDSFTGIGIFESNLIPNSIGDARFMWPYISRDRNNRYHLVVTGPMDSLSRMRIAYSRSADGGSTWSSLIVFDVVRVISSVVVSSPVSNKVAIVYCHPNDTTQYKNDVYYIQSTDGTSWDWSTGIINVTNYGQNDDSFYAFTDLAAVYDYNDNLQIVWNSQRPIPGEYRYYPLTLLNHFDEASGTISEITRSLPTWPDSGCDISFVNRPLCKMSLGVKEGSDSLYLVYTGYDPTDCSISGRANGDIYLNSSYDGGQSWNPAINLTNSRTPRCSPGHCDDDNWPSITERVDGYLRVFYVDSHEVGQDPPFDCSMLYLKVPTSPTGVEENNAIPNQFSLSQNYPNPFNAKTNIDFTLEKKAKVELAVYNLLGAKVATLANGQMEAGKHSINFDASKISSGIYYYTLKTDGSEVSKKMTLLK